MFEIFISACGGWVFVNTFLLHRHISWMNRKPFVCEKCMAGWFCLFSSLSYDWYLIPLMMAAAMVTAIFLTWTLKKL